MRVASYGKEKKKSKECEDWLLSQNFPDNHKQSSGAMEEVG